MIVVNPVTNAIDPVIFLKIVRIRPRHATAVERVVILGVSAMRKEAEIKPNHLIPQQAEREREKKQKTILIFKTKQQKKTRNGNLRATQLNLNRFVYYIYRYIFQAEISDNLK